MAKNYYKVCHVLQGEIEFIAGCDRYYKVRQEVITKCDMYYKLRRNTPLLFT